jgi:hypothetical protein
MSVSNQDGWIIPTAETPPLPAPRRIVGQRIDAPEDAADDIRTLAATGFSKRGIAAHFGVAYETMMRWLDEDDALQEAFNVGRDQERYSLHGGVWFPNGSLVLIDELAAVRKGNVNHGLGWTASVTAEAIRTELCDRWRVQPYGVADDACFARTGATAGSIADEFARAGVTFQPARKADRISGWQKMKRLLADAGKPDRPGLYISRSCEYFWATVPYLARDVKRIEDVDTTGPDHAADACRYGILAQVWARSFEITMPY